MNGDARQKAGNSRCRGLEKRSFVSMQWQETEKAREAELTSKNREFINRHELAVKHKADKSKEL